MLFSSMQPPLRSHQPSPEASFLPLQPDKHHVHTHTHTHTLAACSFFKRAPSSACTFSPSPCALQVVQTIRQTALNFVGSLPPQYFNVRITTMAESLAQLMLSIMTTGYMLRSAQVWVEMGFGVGVYGWSQMYGSGCLEWGNGVGACG